MLAQRSSLRHLTVSIAVPLLPTAMAQDQALQRRVNDDDRLITALVLEQVDLSLSLPASTAGVVLSTGLATPQSFRFKLAVRKLAENIWEKYYFFPSKNIWEENSGRMLLQAFFCLYNPHVFY